MRFSLRSALLALALLFVACAASPVQAAQTPSGLVKDFYAALTETMKEGPKLGFDGRYKKLEPVVTQTFNLPAMARLAVGPAWAKATPDQQQEITKAFTSFSIATYASRFKKFDGEVFNVMGEKPLPQGTIVETTLTPKDEAPVILNYMVRNDETGAPRIMDVYLDASISEMATRRSDFGAVIKREGIDALIKSLDGKVKKMQTQQAG